MAEFFIVYDKTSGEIAWRASDQDGAAAKIALPEGLAALVVPAEALPPSEPIDMTMIAATLCDKIDAEAGAFRSQFITVGAGQEMTYVFKTAEAKAWTAGAPDTDFPFMAAEAAGCGTTVEEVCALVLTTAAQFIYLGSRIEGARLGAKQRVQAATNIKDMVAAATVDWAALATT